MTGAFQEPGPGRAQDMERLRRALAADAPAAVDRFRMLRRLGIYLSYSSQPDSATPFLRQAWRLGAGFEQQVPLEMAVVLERLARDQWQRQALDSAGYFHQYAARMLSQAFPDSAQATRPHKVDGRPVLPAIVLAEHYSNAGLACQSRNKLPEAIRSFERAHRAYEWAADLPGRAWVHTLFAAALQAQHQRDRAGTHYELALEALRQYGQQRPDRAAQEWAGVLAQYSPNLLAARPQRLGALAREGQALIREPLAMHSTNRDLLASATKLALLEAQASPAPGPVLGRAGELLRRLRQAAGPEFRTALGYFPAAAMLAQLQARRARQESRAAEYRRYRTLALAYRDSIDELRARAGTTLTLAQQLVQWQDYPTAISQLRALVPVYRAAADQGELQTVYDLLTRAYAGTGRLDSAFKTQRRAVHLDSALRTRAQQAALADAETRYRTRLQSARISQLTQDTNQQRSRTRLAWLSVGLLLLLLAGLIYALRTARRLNGRLRTQRQQIEEQATRLAGLDQSKNLFFANISHELRTPLTLVLGPTEQLLAENNLPATARHWLEQIRRSGQRLQGLVNNILDLTKLEAGELRLNRSPVMLSAFFHLLVEPFRVLATQRGIRLGLVSSLDPDLTLLLDAEQVEQVVSNLLANALRHTPAGGTVVMSLSQPGEGRWQVSVQDSGPGIAPEERSLIFERFYQSKRHRMEGGTGIGLALSRELAQLMGGTLTVGGNEGEGATFIFCFEAETVAPAAEAVVLAASQEAAPAALAAEAAGPRPRVLLVEDHDELRAYLRQLLGPAYAVREAGNGHEALALLAEEPADLIISDEMMPGMSGTELLRHLQNRPGWDAVPFLLVTARADLAHRLLALDIGVADYLGKPFAAAELLARVRNLLRNRAGRRHFQASDSAEDFDASSQPNPIIRPAPGAVVVAPAPEAAVAVAGTLSAVAHDAELLARLRAATEANLADEDFSPARLAESVHLSERTLYRRLKELTGLTPAAFVREVRLLQARHLLETRAAGTVTEVAFAVGFANASHFGRVYAERFGRPPGADAAH